FQFSELVHYRELRRVHLYRLPLRGPGALHYRASAGARECLWNRGQVSEWQVRLSVDRRAGDLEQRRVPEHTELSELSGCGAGEPCVPAHRPAMLRKIDEDGIMATPANSGYNELVIEAGRASILSGGREVAIEYGENPGIR